jgi:hypothetical protein
VALFDLVVHAPSEGLDLSLDGVEGSSTLVKCSLMAVNFAGAKIGEGIDQASNLGEAFLDSLIQAIEAFLKVALLHIFEV